METDPRDFFLYSLLHNRWFQIAIWIFGGCLWFGSLSSKPPQTDFPPKTPITLQRTQIDGQWRIAWIDGQKVRAGQFLKIDEGVFRVQQIEPGAAVLRHGGRTIQLVLPKPGSWETRESPTSVAGW